MVTINPADCKPGEVYEGTVHGAERTVLVRRDTSDSYPWESLGEVLDHEDVSSLVRLVPAREVTREDRGELWSLIRDELRVVYPSISDQDHRKLDLAASAAADAVVAHLNANGGTPVVMGTAANNTLRETLANVETDRDRWRRAHAIVEQERDQARSERDMWKLEHDRLVVHGSVRGDTYVAMVRERDEALEASALFQRDVHEWRTRAEAAEARTAVTREDVEKAIRTAYNQRGFGYTSGDIEVSTDAVCALFGGEAEPADPVEQKAAELFGAAFPGEAFDQHPYVTQEPWINAARHVLGEETDHA